jgi:hypothetical protein
MNKADFTGFKDTMNLINTSSGVIKRGDFMTIQAKQVLRGLYDFSVLGGAIGAIILKDEDGTNLVIPSKAIVTSVYIDVITAPTSGGSATIALGANTTTDFKAATAIASYTGIVAGVPVGTAATAVKMTADRNITATVAVAALTAGKFYVMVEYIVSE